MIRRCGRPQPYQSSVVSFVCGGAIEEFDDVEDLLAGAMDRDAGAKLQDAAGVGGEDGLRAGRARTLHFFPQQGLEHLLYTDYAVLQRVGLCLTEAAFGHWPNNGLIGN